VSGGRKSGNFSSQSNALLPDFLLQPGSRLIDAASGEAIGGADLRARVAEVAARLGALPPGALFARTSIDVPSVLRYLGAFAAGRAVALLDPSLEPVVLADLVERFRPAAVLGTDSEPPPGYATDSAAGQAWVRQDPGGTEPHPDLAVAAGDQRFDRQPEDGPPLPVRRARQRPVDRRGPRHR